MARGRQRPRDEHVLDQDFYEHLSLSEKIVHGRVQLELPHPETSDDEEEMWSKWEARNHERYVREKNFRDREGLKSRARELGPIGEKELRELKRGGREANGSGELLVSDDASARRRPRSATDKTYARLLTRSRRNSERVKEAFRRSDQARVDEAIALKESHTVSPSHGSQSRRQSPGERGEGGDGSKRERGSPPILKRGDFVSPTPSHASSSRRVSISLRDVDSAEPSGSDSDAAASSSASEEFEDGNARFSRAVTRPASASELGRRPRRRPGGRAASVAGFPSTTPSLRAAASASLRARSASPPRRRAESTMAGVSRGSPAESRALALAIAENDEILAVAGYDVPGGSRSVSGDGDLVAFGQHWTTHGEAARARKEREAEPQKTRRPFTARATTVFRPPRLYTSSRPDERVRSRAATARAWAKQELTEAVVLRTVGSVYGEPGVARHWDDPTRAAAEQAAAKTANESLLTHGDARLANKAARSAARVAAARAARLVHGDGAEDLIVETLLSGETRSVGNKKRQSSRKPFTNAAVLATRSAGDSSGYSETDSDSAAVSSVSGSSLNAIESEQEIGDSSSDDEPGSATQRSSGSGPGSRTQREPGADAFAAFRSELAAIDAEAATARFAQKRRKSASEPTSPRGGEVRERMLFRGTSTSARGTSRPTSRPASAKHGLSLVRDSLERELRRAKLGSGHPSDEKAFFWRKSFDSASVRTQRPMSVRSARSVVDDQSSLAPTRTFLRSGQGGAGMARGRSVAALEELSDPAHAARLRRQLETAAGPALAAARAEQAKAAARVGLAQARLRARAAEAADAEARARATRRRARRDASARTFKSPLFGASNAGAVTSGAIGVVDSFGDTHHVSRPSTAGRRPASASIRANPKSGVTAKGQKVPSRPAFSASPFAPSTAMSRCGDGALRGSLASPYSPIPRVYPAAEARARAEAEAEAAFAAAHRRAIAESPRDKSGFGFGVAGATPVSARASSSGSPRFFSARRPSSAGKHGLQLVRESLDDELEKARGVRG